MAYENVAKLCFSFECKEHVSVLRKSPRMLMNIPRMLTNTYEFLFVITNRFAVVSPFVSIVAYVSEQHEKGFAVF